MRIINRLEVNKAPVKSEVLKTMFHSDDITSNDEILLL